MQQYDSHIGDRELLLAAGGELTAARAAEIRDHLAGCPSCWMRNAALEQTLADVVQAHHREFDGMLPSMERSRALLRARLAQTRGDIQSAGVAPPSPGVGRRDGRAGWRGCDAGRLACPSRRCAGGRVRAQCGVDAWVGATADEGCGVLGAGPR